MAKDKKPMATKTGKGSTVLVKARSTIDKGLPGPSYDTPRERAMNKAAAKAKKTGSYKGYLSSPGKDAPHTNLTPKQDKALATRFHVNARVDFAKIDEAKAVKSRGRDIQKAATKASMVAGKSSATSKSIADRKKAEKAAAKTKARTTKQGARMASKAKSGGGRGRAGGLGGSVGGKPGLGKNPLNS